MVPLACFPVTNIVGQVRIGRAAQIEPQLARAPFPQVECILQLVVEIGVIGDQSVAQAVVAVPVGPQPEAQGTLRLAELTFGGIGRGRAGRELCGLTGFAIEILHLASRLQGFSARAGGEVAVKGELEAGSEGEGQNWGQESGEKREVAHGRSSSAAVRMAVVSVAAVLGGVGALCRP
jgi:hypothetical protein